MLESSLLIPGNVLGNRYQIVRELGRGGFGRSYLAIDLNKFNEKCVLKEFAPQVQGQAALVKAKELFEREAEVLYKFKHPQIPAFRELLPIDSGGSKSLLLVQDYIEGETYLDRLNQRLKQQKFFSEGEIVKLFYSLLPVLDYIHRVGLIHRDISPDNIIYRYSDGLPVLIDFGCVKEIAATVISQCNNVKVATRIGKQGYAPEEQMMRGKVSPSSDLYAIAATALTLLTGQDASTIYSPAEAIWEWRKHVRLTPEFSAILDRLLQHNPQNRYQSAAEVLANLPPLTNYHTAPSSVPTVINTNSIATTRTNKSQLKTIEISPRNGSVSTLTTELPTRNLNEWKKPAGQVTKIGSVILVTCIAVNGIVKWVQIIDPVKIVTDRVDLVTADVLRSIPNPFKSQPLVQQRQQDLNQKLKQLNIPTAKFYDRVDRVFYAKYPELNGRSLTTKAEDDKLRQEWQDTAVTLLEQRTNRSVN